MYFPLVVPLVVRHSKPQGDHFPRYPNLNTFFFDPCLLPGKGEIAYKVIIPYNPCLQVIIPYNQEEGRKT
jgi:hypothetical protein